MQQHLTQGKEDCKLATTGLGFFSTNNCLLKRKIINIKMYILQILNVPLQISWTVAKEWIPLPAFLCVYCSLTWAWDSLAEALPLWGSDPDWLAAWGRNTDHRTDSPSSPAPQPWMGCDVWRPEREGGGEEHLERKLMAGMYAETKHQNGLLQWIGNVDNLSFFNDEREQAQPHDKNNQVYNIIKRTEGDKGWTMPTTMKCHRGCECMGLANPS